MRESFARSRGGRCMDREGVANLAGNVQVAPTPAAKCARCVVIINREDSRVTRGEQRQSRESEYRISADRAPRTCQGHDARQGTPFATAAQLRTFTGHTGCLARARTHQRLAHSQRPAHSCQSARAAPRHQHHRRSAASGRRLPPFSCVARNAREKIRCGDSARSLIQNAMRQMRKFKNRRARNQ
jgi:hypothetical protein